MQLQLFKNKKSFVWGIKLIATIGLIYFCFSRFGKLNGHMFDRTLTVNVHYLVLLLCLLPLNYLMEWKKWKLILHRIHFKDKSIGYQSFFAGIVTGMFTPNMLGNFIGRMYYFSFRDRPKIVLYTLYNNAAQFLVTIAFGGIALFFIDSKAQLLWPPIELVLAILFLGFYLYFFGERLASLMLKRKSKALVITSLLQEYQRKKSSAILYSILRYFIFSLQYLCALLFFDVQPSMDLYLSIWLLYLLTTMVPSLFLGKLGIRESLSLVVFTSFGIADYTLVFASLLIWLVNLVIPTVFGLIYCKSKTNLVWSSQ